MKRNEDEDFVKMSIKYLLFYDYLFWSLNNTNDINIMITRKERFGKK